MPWTCVLHASRDDARLAGGGRIAVGAMWWRPELLLEPNRRALSPRYWREDAGRRPPLVVMLPGRVEFCVDFAAYSVERGQHGDGWSVAGEPPRITVSPSINCVGIYHGYIRDGVITDDCEGRRFER